MLNHKHIIAILLCTTYFHSCQTQSSEVTSDFCNTSYVEGYGGSDLTDRCMQADCSVQSFSMSMFHHNLSDPGLYKWRINGKPNLRIILQLTVFDLQDCCDYFEITEEDGTRNGFDSGRFKVDQMFCKDPLMLVYISDTSQITLTTTSHHPREFQVTYQVTDALPDSMHFNNSLTAAHCPGAQNSNTARHSFRCTGDHNLIANSSNQVFLYPNPARRRYWVDTDCVWRITGNQRSIIELDFLSFGTEMCCDYVKIFEDGQPSVKLRGKRNRRNSEKFRYISRSNTLSIQFVSDGNTLGTGFRLLYRTVPNNTTGDFRTNRAEKLVPCLFTDTATSAIQSMSSPGWPQNHPENLDCKWVIKAKWNQRISLNVWALDVGKATFKVKDVRRSISYKRPFAYVSKTNSIILRFFEKPNKNGVGFSATYQIYSSEHENTSHNLPAAGINNLSNQMKQFREDCKAIISAVVTTSTNRVSTDSLVTESTSNQQSTTRGNISTLLSTITATTKSKSTAIPPTKAKSTEALTTQIPATTKSILTTNIIPTITQSTFSPTTKRLDTQKPNTDATILSNLLENTTATSRVAGVTSPAVLSSIEVTQSATKATSPVTIAMSQIDGATPPEFVVTPPINVSTTSTAVATSSPVTSVTPPVVAETSPVTVGTLPVETSTTSIARTTSAAAVATSPAVTVATSPAVTVATSPAVAVATSPAVTVATSPAVTVATSPAVTVETSPAVAVATSPAVTVETSPAVTVATSPAVTVETSPAVAVATSPAVAVATSPAVTVATSPAVTVATSPAVAVETSPAVTVATSPAVTVATSPAVTVATSPAVTVETSPAVAVATSPAVTVATSPAVTVATSPAVTVATSPAVAVETSPAVTVETSPMNVETTSLTTETLLKTTYSKTNLSTTSLGLITTTGTISNIMVKTTARPSTTTPISRAETDAKTTLALPTTSVSTENVHSSSQTLPSSEMSSAATLTGTQTNTVTNETSTVTLPAKLNATLSQSLRATSRTTPTPSTTNTIPRSTTVTSTTESSRFVFTTFSSKSQDHTDVLNSTEFTTPTITTNNLNTSSFRAQTTIPNFTSGVGLTSESESSSGSGSGSRSQQNATDDDQSMQVSTTTSSSRFSQSSIEVTTLAEAPSPLAIGLSKSDITNSNTFSREEFSNFRPLSEDHCSNHSMLRESGFEKVDTEESLLYVKRCSNGSGRPFQTMRCHRRFDITLDGACGQTLQSQHNVPCNITFQYLLNIATRSVHSTIDVPQALMVMTSLPEVLSLKDITTINQVLTSFITSSLSKKIALQDVINMAYSVGNLIKRFNTLSDDVSRNSKFSSSLLSAFHSYLNQLILIESCKNFTILTTPLTIQIKRSIPSAFVSDRLYYQDLKFDISNNKSTNSPGVLSVTIPESSLVEITQQLNRSHPVFFITTLSDEINMDTKQNPSQVITVGTVNSPQVPEVEVQLEHRNSEICYTKNTVSPLQQILHKEKLVNWSFPSASFQDANHCHVVNRSNISRTIRCTRFASYAILRSSTKIPANVILTTAGFVGCLIVVCFLLITVIINVIPFKLRHEHTTPPLVNTCVCLALLYLFFAFGIGATDNKHTCNGITFVMHYLALTVFSWITVSTCQIYFGLKLNFIPIHLMTYGFPFLFVLLNVIFTIWVIDERNPDTDICFESAYRAGYMCWLQPPSLYWGFLLPLAVLLVFNCLVFLLLIRKLLSSRDYEVRSPAGMNPSAKELKCHQFINIVVIIASTIVTWILGYYLVISEHVNRQMVLQCFFTVFLIIQGLAIFYWNCIRLSNVRATWLPCSKKSDEQMTYWTATASSIEPSSTARVI